MSKQEWKESGTELGHAFKDFGKTFVRSAQTTTDKVVSKVDGATKDEKELNVDEAPQSTVYSDGSWKKVGKGLGQGFAGIGKTMLHTVGIGKEGEGAKPEETGSEVQEETKEAGTEENKTEE